MYNFADRNSRKINKRTNYYYHSPFREVKKISGHIKITANGQINDETYNLSFS
jgi:hypothetical protein